MIKSQYVRIYHFIMNKKEVRKYFDAIASVFVFTIVNKLLSFSIVAIDQIMIYLIGTIAVAIKFGRKTAIIYSLLSVISFNFFFVEPLFSFNFYDQSYFTTFIVMLLTSIVIASQAEKVKNSKIEVENEKLRSTLLSSISHDLRTPLASIMGLSSSISALAKNDNNSEILKLSEAIYGSSQKLTHIINNLLDITRLESEAIKLNKQFYFIEELIGSALLILKDSLADRQIKINIDQNQEMIMVDGILIEQLLINLLENAVKYTSKNGIIEIIVTKEKNELLVSITDNGQGIKIGEEENIFDKFYTTSNNKNRIESRGAGLGLAICKNIILLHQGKIWAENKFPNGAKFNFTLPIINIRNERDSGINN